jgi:hypothetical protein
MRHEISTGVTMTGINTQMLERIAGIHNLDEDVDLDMLNEAIEGQGFRRRRGIHSTNFWDSFCCMEEMLRAQEESNAAWGHEFGALHLSLQ